MGYSATAPSGASPLGGFRARGYGARRRRGLGQFDLSSLLGMAGSSDGSSSTVDTIGSAAGLASNALVPGAGAVVTPIIDTIGQLFGGGGVSTADTERQQHIYSYYYQAMTLPGSPSSVDAVATLYDIANQINGQNNPQITRTYAQTALTRLSSQGWINTSSDNPVYVGVVASSAPTGALATTLPRPYGSTGGIGLGTLLVIGVIGYVGYKAVA